MFEIIKTQPLALSIFLPILSSLFLFIFRFLKNPIYIRNFSYSMALINFLFFSGLFFSENEICFRLLNFDFLINKTSLFFIFLLSLIVFLFTIFSKNFIKKSHKLFFISLFLIQGLVNFTFSIDNLFVVLINIFWIILIYFLLNSLFLNNSEEKKSLEKKLTFDIFIYFISIFLISYDFIRYFLLNDVEPNLKNIIATLSYIDNSSIILCFLGFLILIFKFFNFIPFSYELKVKNTATQGFVDTIQLSVNLFLGLSLFLKTFSVFEYLFYDFQIYIILFILINFVFYCVLSTRKDYLSKISKDFIPCYISLGLFSVFSFNQENLGIFSYMILALIASYCFISFCFLILKEKFGVDNLSEINKISEKSSRYKFFLGLALLNLIKLPSLALFSACLICLISAFTIEFENEFLNLVPYLLILGILYTSLSSCGLINKILIEPTNQKTDILLSRSENICFSLILFIVILISFSFQYLIKNIFIF